MAAPCCWLLLGWRKKLQTCELVAAFQDFLGFSIEL
jgi:hypothetical protein